MRRRSRRSSAYTLTELLLVTVVVSIVSAILFPVFVRARETSRENVCVSNLRQIASAMHLYARDNDGAIPPSRECNGIGLPGCEVGDVTLGWMDKYAAYLKSDNAFKCPDDPTAPVPLPAGTRAFSTAKAGQGYVWTTSADYSIEGGANRCSYGRNNNLANNGNYSAHIGSIRYPATTIAFFDFSPNMGSGDSPGEQKGSPFSIIAPSDIAASSSDSGTGFYSYLTPDQQLNEQMAPSATRHSGGANYAFVDGHVKWLRPDQVNGEPAYATKLDIGNDGVHPDFRV